MNLRIHCGGNAVEPETEHHARDRGQESNARSGKPGQEPRYDRTAYNRDQDKIEQTHEADWSSRPVSSRYASLYLSLVFSAISSGSSGAGGCLFHLIDSK